MNTSFIQVSTDHFDYTCNNVVTLPKSVRALSMFEHAWWSPKDDKNLPDIGWLDVLTDK